MPPQRYVKYVFAANPKAILELIADVERLETITNGYKNANAEAQEIIAELRIKNARLEKEADWLAENGDIGECPPAIERDKFSGVALHCEKNCKACWRTAAHQAVAERAEQNDIEPR